MDNGTRAVSEGSVKLVPPVCAIVDSNRIAVYGFRTRQGIRALEIRKGPVEAEHRDRALHTDLIPRDIDHKSRIVERRYEVNKARSMSFVLGPWGQTFNSQGGMAEKRLARAGVIAIKRPAMSN